jgi:hypothetical protein
MGILPPPHNRISLAAAIKYNKEPQSEHRNSSGGSIFIDCGFIESRVIGIEIYL